jgi:hypothetical protein
MDVFFHLDSRKAGGNELRVVSEAVADVNRDCLLAKPQITILPRDYELFESAVAVDHLTSE